MPKKAPTPCRHAGCAALIDKPGFCEAHARESSGWQRDAYRGSRHDRGYGAEWIRLRNRIMQRDCGLCQPCLREQRITKAVAVDHIVPKSERGSDDDDNLQAICKDCHATKTAIESARARGRVASG